MGERAARYAEYHMADLCHLLDYKPRSRFVLHVFPTPESYWNSSLYYHSKGLPQGGMTQLNGNSAAVYYVSGQTELYQQIREAATSLIMHEIYYGQTVQFALQQQMMLDLPEFFLKGIPAWEAEGWTAADEARMRSLNARQYVPNTLFEEDPDLTRTLQKSVWHYIAQKFGPVKVYSIMYMTRVTRSVQSGIITVLGVSMESFTDRWREFFVQRYQADVATRRNLAKETKEAKVLPNGYRLCQAAMQPGGEKIAAVGEKDGRYTLWLTDVRTGKQQHWKLPGGIYSRQGEVQSLPVPMSWDFSGKNLALVLTQGTAPALIRFSAETRSLKKTKLPGGLEQVQGLDWNQEKGWMALTASRKGQSDLFMLSPEGQLVQLTSDWFDDYNPVWSLDANSIFISTNRKSDSLGNYPAESLERDLDIYRFSLEDDTLYTVTSIPLSNERPLFQLNSYELNYLTEESGIPGLARRNVFIPDSVQLTAFDAGIERIEVRQNRALIVAWSGGKRRAFLAENPGLNKALKPQLTELQKIKRQEWAEAERNRKSLAEPEEPEEEDLPEVPENSELIQVSPVDSSGSKKPLKYYLFDDDDVPARPAQVSPRQVSTRPGQTSNVPKIPAKEANNLPRDWTFAEAKTPGKGNLKRNWMVRELGTEMGFDPLFRFHYNLFANISDSHRQHEIGVLIRPYLQFRNSDFQLRYEWRKHRLQPGASFNRAVRFYDRQGFELRYTIHSYRAWLGYSFNRRLRFTAGLRIEGLWRKDLSVNYAFRYPAEMYLPGTFARLEYDHTQKRENFIRSGTRANLRMEHYLLIGAQRSDPLVMIQGDFRKYVRVLKESVLAMRFTGGMSIGAVKPDFLTGGVDNWLNSRFQNVGDLPVPAPVEGLWLMQIQSPVRGFPYNARAGKQFAAMNAELRLPLLKYLTRRLNSDPLYNFQWVIFYDIATAWTTGNPISQRNPVNTQTIEKNPFIIQVQSLKSPFFSGAGTGIRMSVMRYILRMDFALGMEDGVVAKPQFSISLGSDF